ncbi:hypothetical protein F5Y12DRAFT_776687 [Xylaria sp. FL1777]|nr:hypothetical protein F5Y12DRAFT_776687 [Xylaria sp. FL1777]
MAWSVRTVLILSWVFLLSWRTGVIPMGGGGVHQESLFSLHRGVFMGYPLAMAWLGLYR